MNQQTLPIGMSEEQELMNFRPDFERLWKCFIETEKRGLGRRGDKPPAREQFKKLKPDAVTFRAMIEGLRIQAASKLHERRATGYCDNFKHAFRWIRNRSWEELPITPEQEEQNRYSEIVQKHTDRSWAE